MLKAICLGRASYEIDIEVDRIPDEGSVMEFFDKKGGPSGSATIMASCLAKWGIATAMTCVLGNDINGTRVRKHFEKIHVDTRNIEPTYDNDTPLSIVEINRLTRKHTTYNLSDKYISIKKSDYDFNPDIICVDGYDAVQAKALLERFPNCPSVLDANLITTPVIELLKKAKYAICSREFAEYVARVKIDFQDMSTLVELYQTLQKKYLKTTFIITLGEQGALYCIDNQIKISPSLKVEVKDTHACGPIFRAAFAHTIATGGDVEKAVKMGCIASGLSTREIGAIPSIPTLEEMKNIYDQNY